MRSLHYLCAHHQLGSIICQAPAKYFLHCLVPVDITHRVSCLYSQDGHTSTIVSLTMYLINQLVSPRQSALQTQPMTLCNITLNPLASEKSTQLCIDSCIRGLKPCRWSTQMLEIIVSDSVTRGVLMRSVPGTLDWFSDWVYICGSLTPCPPQMGHSLPNDVIFIKTFSRHNHPSHPHT